MGEVFLATQLSTGARRAVKLMRAELLLDVRLRERFEQEARLGASIPSDHVAQVVAAGVDDALAMPFLALEYLEGAELGEVVTQLGGLTLGELDSVLRQLCHALGAAHAMGIVHRDVKPSNVFLTRSRSADSPVMLKVLDFGIAKLLADAGTRSTQAMGTPLWVSPEQTEKRASVTPATDVWALGLVAFHALTGRLYWASAQDGDDASLAAVMRELLVEPLEAASVRAQGLGASIPDALDAWFSRCIARRPDERFANASLAYEAFAAAIAPLLAASARPERGPAALVRALDAVAACAVRASSTASAGPVASTPASIAAGTPPAAATSSSSHRVELGPALSASVTRFEAPLAVDVLPANLLAGAQTELSIAAPATADVLCIAPLPEASAPVARARKPWIVPSAIIGAVIVVGGVFAASRPKPVVSGEGLASAATASARGASSASALPLLASTIPSASPSAAAPAPACPEGMTLIPAGVFPMGTLAGTTEERPVHDVKVDAFCMDTLEVTAGAFEECVKAGACTAPTAPEGDDQQACTYGVSERSKHPINCVDWNQASAFCARAGKRLPLEEEWEYAARGTDGRPFPWGTSMPTATSMNACGTECSAKDASRRSKPLYPGDDGHVTTSPVGSFLSDKSPFGVLDMGGNVSEWTASYHSKDYASPPNTARRVLRGSAWLYGTLPNHPDGGMTTIRWDADPSTSNYVAGFRCARSLPGGQLPVAIAAAASGAPADGASAPPSQSPDSGSSCVVRCSAAQRVCDQNLTACVDRCVNRCLAQSPNAAPNQMSECVFGCQGAECEAKPCSVSADECRARCGR